MSLGAAIRELLIRSGTLSIQEHGSSGGIQIALFFPCHHFQGPARSALIVGGDRVGVYREFLASHGFAPVRHWSGRKSGECHRTIPLDTRVVVLMVDQLNHGLARKIRRVADEMAVPVIFSKRSIGQLSDALAGVGGLAGRSG